VKLGGGVSGDFVLSAAVDKRGRAIVMQIPFVLGELQNAPLVLIVITEYIR
jgi:hypothetical protein